MMLGLPTDRCTTCGGGNARHVVDDLPYCRTHCTRCAAKWDHLIASSRHPAAASAERHGQAGPHSGLPTFDR